MFRTRAAHRRILPSAVREKAHAAFVEALNDPKVKVPPAVLAALRGAVRSAADSAEMGQKLTGMGAEPRNGSSDGLRSLLNRESTVWSKVIKDSGITLQ